MLRKILSLTVILSILFTFLNLNIGIISSAQEKLKEGYYTYTVKNGEATITACDNSISGDVIVPDTLGGYPVTKIQYIAFMDCVGIKCIILPDSIKEIENGVFKNCNSLMSITLPYIDKNIGCFFAEGFDIDEMCGIVDIKGVEEFTDFSDYIPESLKNITLSDNCQSVGDRVFANCTTLTSINIGKNVKKIGKFAFAGCYNVEEIFIPEGVTEIQEYAFIGTKIKNISIPISMKKIGEDAFSHCRVDNVYYMGNPIQWRQIDIAERKGLYTKQSELKNAKIHYTYSETECDKHTYLSEDSKRCGVCGKERSSEKAEKPTQNTNSTASKPNNTSSKNETVSQENVNGQETESDTDSITQNEENTTGTIGATEPDNNENKSENTNTDNGEKDSNGWIWIIVAVFAVIIIGAVVLFLLYKKGIIFNK